MKTRGAAPALLLPVLAVCCILLSGCALFKSKIPTATVFPDGRIATGGDAATPAHVNETTTHAVLPVASASIVTTDPKDGTVKVQLSQPTQLTVDTKNTKVDGPVAFTPPAPPTPSQIAQGSVLKWFCLAGLVCLLFAAFLAYAGHYLAAIKIAAAGIAMPILGRFFSSQLALIVGSILVTAGIVFVIAWYVMEAKKKTVPAIPEPPKS